MSWSHVLLGLFVGVLFPAIPLFIAYRVGRWQRRRLAEPLSGETLTGIIAGVVILLLAVGVLLWYMQAMGCSLVTTEFEPSHRCYPLVTPT